MLRSAHPSELAGTVSERWIERIFATYPPETARFLAGERDRFANPVGHAVREAAAVLVGALWDETTGEAVDEALDRILRIRSVQDLSPSEAVGFVFLLKGVLRETLDGDADVPDSAELLRLERRLDAMALRAFDIYMGCREQLFEVRLHERDRWNAVALKRIGKQTRVARRLSSREHGNDCQCDVSTEAPPRRADSTSQAPPGETPQRQSNPESQQEAGEEYGSRPGVGVSSGMTPSPELGPGSSEGTEAKVGRRNER